ncbi:beta-lactamase [Microthyrium microscopicum]|uniref:Beta-lactamase n=1 Tax=Microthyrium microscopicum TaxID=703497 RepID=A0A6A6ULV5_9PEZI|nr:beta-lactamase [Microthyrium microscopicum]
MGGGQGGQAESASEWEAILAEATKREADIAPGLVLLAVDKNGKSLYHKACGFNSRLPDAPAIKDDDIMWIASCTKLLTSVCALRCVERGQVDLDEDLGQSHLPEFKNPMVVTLDDSEKGYNLRPAKNPITLRRLLTHTSGVAYEWGDSRLRAWRKDVGPIPDDKKGFMQHLYDIPLLFDPGEGWVYGGGIDWAGILVGRLNNTTLGGYMEEHIFKPLGMKDTTFYLSTRPDLEKRLVRAGKRGPDGGMIPFEGMVFRAEAHDESGGGGLWSCATDYIKVLADLIKDEPTLLKRDTVVNMLAKPQLKDGEALKALSKGRGGAVAANAANPSDAGINYGLGGMVQVKTSAFLPGGTLSWGGLPNLKWFIHPELGIAAMYATQVMPSGDAKNLDLSRKYFKEIIRLSGN